MPGKCSKCNSLLITLYYREYKYNPKSWRNVGDINPKARVWKRTKAKYCKKCQKVINY